MTPEQRTAALKRIDEIASQRRELARDNVNRMMSVSLLLNSGGIVLLLPLIFEYTDQPITLILLIPVSAFISGLIVIAWYYWQAAKRAITVTAVLESTGRSVERNEVTAAEAQRRVAQGIAAAYREHPISDRLGLSSFMLFAVGVVAAAGYLLLLLLSAAGWFSHRQTISSLTHKSS